MHRWLMVLCVSLIWPLTIHTQEDNLIELGATVEAVTDESNVAYTIALTAETAVDVSLSSPDFDTYLEVLGPEGNLIEENDDRAPDIFDSHLDFIVPEDGAYTILVRSWIGEADGTYTLTVTEIGSADCGDICVGNTLEGTTTDRLRLVTQLEAGQSVLISADSPNFDTVLELYDAENNFIAQNDDSARDNFNSELEYTADADGDYTIILRAFSGDTIGNYTISLENLEISSLDGGTLNFDETVRIEPEGTSLITFDFTAEAEDVINLRAVSSEDEDTRLFIYTPDGEYLIDDDDSGDGRNPSIVRLTLSEAGTYSVELEAFDGSPLIAPLTVTLEKTELLLLEDGQRTVTFDQDTSLEVIDVDVEDGATYLVEVASDDLIEDLQLDIFDGNGNFMSGTISSFVDSTNFTYTSIYSGLARMEVRVFAFSPQELTITMSPLEDESG